MSDIPTWHERAMRHPDHQTGMVSEDMIRARMCEEIADLRAEVERMTREQGKARTEIERLRDALSEAALLCCDSAWSCEVVGSICSGALEAKP